jgi:hypothetical protein
MRMHGHSRRQSRMKTAIPVLIASALAACVGSDSGPASVPSDDTAAVQAAVDAGGVITFPPGQYTLTKTITVSKSGTVIQGAGAIFNFKPATPPTDCANEAAFTTPCIDTLPRQVIVSPIAIGDISFTAAGDLTSLVSGAWLSISQRDNKSGNIVSYDWAQVESVVGQVVTTATPFRTAFSNAQPFDPSFSGLGFVQIPVLVENVEFRNITVNTAPGTVPFQIDGALNTTIDGVTANSSNQSLYSYLSKGLTVRNSSATGGVLSEFAATVDLQLLDNVFSASQGPGFGLDLGTAFFTVSGNRVTASINIGVYLFIGVHDGTVENNQVAYVNKTANYNTVGLLVMGAYNCIIINNYLAGGAGTQSTGLFVGSDDSESVPIPSVNNVTAPNSFGPEWGSDYGG